eukprot:15443168-Alexandrium_andersonii.AAC.1
MPPRVRPVDDDYQTDPDARAQETRSEQRESPPRDRYRPSRRSTQRAKAERTAQEVLRLEPPSAHNAAPNAASAR